MIMKDLIVQKCINVIVFFRESFVTASETPIHDESNRKKLQILKKVRILPSVSKQLVLN